MALSSPFALVTLRSCSLFAVMRSCPSRVDTSVLHGFTSVLLLLPPSSVKWAQPWVLLGGCLGTELHRGSRSLSLRRLRGPRPLSSSAVFLKCLNSGCFPSLSSGGPNRDEYTHVVLHMFIPWRLPASGTKQVSKQPSDIF